MIRVVLYSTILFRQNMAVCCSLGIRSFGSKNVPVAEKVLMFSPKSWGLEQIRSEYLSYVRMNRRIRLN